MIFLDGDDGRFHLFPPPPREDVKFPITNGSLVSGLIQSSYGGRNIYSNNTAARKGNHNNNNNNHHTHFNNMLNYILHMESKK